MSGLFGAAKATFEVVGELAERRLVTPKNSESDWRLYVLKISTAGCTIEVEVSKDEFDAAVDGDAYHVTGRLGVVAGRTKLEAQSVKRLSERSRVSA